MIGQWSAAVLIVTGSFFSLLAAVGVLRMPDVYMRIQAATKASTLGVCSILVAATLLLDGADVTARALLVVAFLLLTAPISAHMIGRSAYSSGVPLWSGTETDELGDHAAEKPRNEALNNTDDR